MSYAVLQDMLDRFNEGEILIVAESESTPGTVDTVQVDAALNDAVADVDLHVGTRYTLPLPEPLPERTAHLLKRCTCDIAFYYLGKDTIGDSEAKRHRYDQAMKTLDKIAKGQVVLQINTHDSDDDDSDLDEPGDKAEFHYAARLFSRNTLGGVL